MAQWKARRASGEQAYTIRKIVSTLYDADEMKRIGVTTLPGSNPVNFTFIEHEEQRRNLVDHLDLLVITMHKKLWYQLRYNTTLPHLWCCIFHPNEARRVAGMRSAERVWTQVMAAEKYCRENKGPVSTMLRKLLDCVYFSNHQFVLEAALLCQKYGWVHTNEALRRHMQPMCMAPSQTKTTNEDGFNVIRDLQRLHKNKDTGW